MALAVVFHAVINTAVLAAIRLFPEPERPLVWGIAATLWLLSGLAAAVTMRRPPG